MILSVAVSHCLCDGIGTSQFLNAWAHFTARPNLDPPITPFHTRHVLKSRDPPHIAFTHPEFTLASSPHPDLNLHKYLQSQPLLPASLTFTASHILLLKRRCVPSLKCTTFEVLASHTWRSWVKSLDLAPSVKVKLLFSVNVRKRVNPELPLGYYGNGFVLGCAEANVNELVDVNLHAGTKLVQQAKSTLIDNYVKSMIDLLEDKTVKTDLSTSLIISQWSKLGLEEVDFGEGKPVLMGPLTSDIYCYFLPVLSNKDAVRVLVSMPETVVKKFEFYMTEFIDEEGNNKAENGHFV